MGSPGKRRGRRTRSDEPGGSGIGGGWPVFRHVSFSPEGSWERWQAFRTARRGLSPEEELTRARSALRSALPLMGLFVGVVLVATLLLSSSRVWLAAVVLGALLLARRLRR